jgi:hypothetical protein
MKLTVPSKCSSPASASGLLVLPDSPRRSRTVMSVQPSKRSTHSRVWLRSTVAGPIPVTTIRPLPLIVTGASSG